jgi:hypothetical protein
MSSDQRRDVHVMFRAERVHSGESSFINASKSNICALKKLN